MKVRKIDRRAQGRSRIEWVLDYYEGPKRIRKFYPSRAQADSAADEIKQQHKHAGQSWIDLSPEERNDLMLLVSDARKENVTLRQVWEAYKSGKLDATPLVRRTLREAVTETIAAKKAENLRERYVDELENYLDKFVKGREAQYVDRITVADVEQWFDARKEALATRRSNLGRLSAMFDVCWRRGYVPENICKRITPPKVDQKPAAILSPDQAKALLTICLQKHRVILPWLVLGMFAGIRPEEIEKLAWEDIDLKQGHAVISAAASKVRNRRTAPLPCLAVEWLNIFSAKKRKGSVTPNRTTLRRHRRKLAKDAKVQWVQDILRHTAASYLVQLHQDVAKVAHGLGHSPRTLETKYKNIVSPDDCKKFWALTPSAIKKGGAK